MRYLATFLILILLVFVAIAQDNTTEKPEPKNTQEEYVPLDLGQSWEDISMDYMRQGDYPEAIYWLRRWLEADPQDSNSWYNLACLYSLNEQIPQALTAFENSVDTGWTDTEHPKRDTDLELIWEEPRFEAAMKRIKKAAPDGPEDFERNFVEMKRYGTYIAMLPPDYKDSEKAYPLCLILHGHGSTELGHGRLADVFGRKDVIYVAIRYPYIHSGVFLQMDKPGYTAYPEYRLKEGMWQNCENMIMDWIMACTEDAKERYRIAGEKIFVFGHSQGAGLANDCAFLFPELVESSFAYAGWVREAYYDQDYTDQIIENEVKLFLVHCEKDPVVPVQASKTPAEKLKNVGVDCTLKVFPEGNHGVTKDVAEFAKNWLDKYVRPKAKKVEKDENDDSDEVPAKETKSQEFYYN